MYLTAVANTESSELKSIRESISTPGSKYPVFVANNNMVAREPKNK
ncbi:hypothetical protein THOG11_20111 [Vibrio harveyi]|nr:hypothetical protein THOG11_20111 [Vibrio harveyi]